MSKPHMASFVYYPESRMFKFENQELPAHDIVYIKRDLFKWKDNMRLAYRERFGLSHHTFTRSMKALEEELNDFYRCHPNYLINLDHIVRIYPEECVIWMSGGELVKVSKSKIDDLCSRYQLYRDWKREPDYGTAKAGSRVLMYGYF